MEIRYEALVGDPEGAMRRICRFIGEDYNPRMLEPDEDAADTHDPLVAARFINNPTAGRAPSGESIGRWQRGLTLKEREAVDEIAGELLRGLGYVEDSRWVLND